jgi:hypothetical protein
MGKRLDSDKKIKYHNKTSRQAQDQKRYKELGLCIRCQQPMWEGVSKQYCEKHTIMIREKQREKKGYQRRYLCKSYEKESK